MSWSASVAAFLEILKRAAEKCMPTVEEEALSDRAKAEKGFLAWLRKIEISSKKREKEDSTDS